MTSKELSYLNDTLTAEENIIKKYRDYENTIQDTQLKDICKKLAQQHQEHFDKLFNCLNK